MYVVPPHKAAALADEARQPLRAGTARDLAAREPARPDTRAADRFVLYGLAFILLMSVALPAPALFAPGPGAQVAEEPSPAPAPIVPAREIAPLEPPQIFDRRASLDASADDVPARPLRPAQRG